LKRKGKEIMEEQDAKSGSPKLLPPPELLDEEEAAEWLQVCAAGYSISSFQ
jgi:hypothetical protein